MFIIESIFEEDYIFEILKKKWLLRQYKKTKNNILTWNFWWSDFRYRHPKKDKVLYFRINKQFRVFCYLEWKSLIVFELNNYQN